ncbi:DUF4421 domain-containing protein [Chitinophaga lutea]
MNTRNCFLLILCLLPAHFAAAQKLMRWLEADLDTNYVENHAEDLTFRLYGSRKFTYFDMNDRNLKKEVMYRPNSNNNVGFGANYKWLGLNIGFKLPFLNNDDDKYGSTRYLDLQSHLYLRRMVVDFYGQYYEGYYESDRRGIAGGPSTVTAIRPDIRSLDWGLNVQYIFNADRFSYRAAFLQNEYQKKSAGSLMAGGEIFSWDVQGDSSLVPFEMREMGFFEGSPFKRTRAVGIAANIGYAYTLVIRKHFFITASLLASGGVNQTIFRFSDGRPSDKGWGWLFNNTVRFAAGYNSSKFFAGIHYTDMLSRSESPIPRTHQAFGSGNLRFSVARRFSLRKPLF